MDECSGPCRPGSDRNPSQKPSDEPGGRRPAAATEPLDPKEGKSSALGGGTAVWAGAGGEGRPTQESGG